MGITKLKDDLQNLGKRVAEQSQTASNEEQTKNAFIMPFFVALGYNVFDPIEFIPEFTADVGIKKGEKVDYAIKIDNKLEMLIECKSINENLANHDSQLFRYFAATNARFGILANGREYWFFTDIDKVNTMDSTPFLTIDITKLRDNQIAQIAKFHKESFDVERILSSTEDLKYVNNFKQFLTDNIESPTEDFTKFIIANIYPRRATTHAIKKFQPIISRGFDQLVSEKVSEKLNEALKTADNNAKVADEKANNEGRKESIKTTERELEFYTISKLLMFREFFIVTIRAILIF